MPILPDAGAVDGTGEGLTSFAGGSVLLFWHQVLGNAGYFVAALLLARSLGPEGRGAMAFIIVAALLIPRLARIGVAEATAIFAAQRPADRPVLLANLAVFPTAAALVAAAAVTAGLLLLGESRPAGLGPTELLALALGAVTTALFDAGSVFLVGCRRFRERAVIGATAPWLYALLLAATAYAFGLTVTGAAFIWIAAHAVGALAVLSAAARGIGFGRPDRRLLSESVRFGLRAWVGTLSGQLNFRGDQILMGFITARANLGIYAVAVNVSEILLYLPLAVSEALVPFLAASGPHERTERTLRTFRILVMSTAASIVAAALLGPPLMPLVFGDAFEGSVAPFLWLLPGALGFATLRVFSNALAASSLPGRSSLGPLVSLVVAIVLDLLLIPRLGASGAAMAASAAFLAGGTTALALYRSRTRFQWRDLVPRARDVDRDGLRRVVVELLPLLRPRARAGITRMRSVFWQVRGRSRASAIGLRILFYHRISDDHDELAVPVTRFREQMDFLAAEGYEVIDVARAGELLARRDVSRRVIALSFDDGYLDVAENALPMLEEHGFRATVFVVTGAIDGTTSFAWYRRQPPLLTWGDIVQLDRGSPLRFEPHSVTHPNLLAVPLDRARLEIFGSKAALEARLQRPVSVFCYPGGLFGARERALVAASGYRMAASCDPGVNLPGTDLLALRRIQIFPSDELLDFRAKVGGGHDSPPFMRSLYRRLLHGATDSGPE